MNGKKDKRLVTFTLDVGPISERSCNMLGDTLAVIARTAHETFGVDASLRVCVPPPESTGPISGSRVRGLN